MAKPTEKTDWATLGAGGGGGSSAIRTATDSTRWDFGWQTTPGNLPGEEGERPNLNEQNYWQYAVHQWITYFEGITDITQNAVVPLGGIIGVSSDLTGAFDSASGVVTNGFILCDGTAIPGTETVSGTTPNLTDSRFLMGTSTAGNTGGNASNQINIQHSHTVDSHTHSAGSLHAQIAVVTGLSQIYFRSLTGAPSYTATARVTGSGGTTVSQAATDNVGVGGTSGSATPGTDSQLSTTQSILPQYYTVKYFMRVS